MKYKATIRASLLMSPDVKITLGEPLEVSLDCHICNRQRRTVVMPEGKPAYCTPTRHVHSAQVLGNEIRRTTDRAEIIYQFSYEFENFWDKKYQSTASNKLGWSRISFTLTCPQCGKDMERSTQQNIVRPWSCVCDCGYVLYVDDEETPVFDTVEESA